MVSSIIPVDVAPVHVVVPVDVVPDPDVPPLPVPVQARGEKVKLSVLRYPTLLI